MTHDRSRGAAQAALSSNEAESGAREPWYDRLLQVLHLKPRDSLRGDIEEALAEPDSGENAFSPLERAMLKNVLGLHKVRVDDVMIPRADIVAVSVETSLGDLLKLFRTAGHSRLPVYGETLDDPRGMVHIRDFVDHIAARAEAAPRRSAAAAANGATPAPAEAEAAKDALKDAQKPAPRVRRAPARALRTLNLGNVDLTATLASTRIQRPVLFVPPSMPAIDLLVRMQATRTHMALVIDEYGGTDGLISIEDLIEMVVGDIEDEHDVVEGRLVQRLEGEAEVFVADARAPLAEVSEATGVDLVAAVGEMAEEIDTIGGMIVTLAGRVPSRGELIAGPGDLEFEVLDADPRRLKRLRFQRGPARIAASAVPLALPPPAAPPAVNAIETPAP
ncbi:hemolysin family protein [Methylobacterium sp. E-041]|jgi:CBS domain containing-hemolysin-like protein|uniref:CBS domain-containing protein n=2 Tax=Methylobacterium TaxID=407 RepID=UPI0011CCAD4E|nr:MULTISPECIES: hemolysin family protein [unclassified Methylobacterium]MCJ2008135.1 hemolysin family protein [Methylobacterium sp. J-092]MCJ2075242.1 hemolysin family protein [Methylobacterium sp. E-016]MCJ2108446.1 hemolysin family protein [Methylobacterium sp. E-041]MCJ2112518.1 hemolysin family protein [Methylobacterium sp. E-025]TXN50329.1 HlyC/CorC family transporter [Methylobacterium sp. WL119]